MQSPLEPMPAKPSNQTAHPDLFDEDLDVAGNWYHARFQAKAVVTGKKN
jgi:hypothetical protein